MNTTLIVKLVTSIIGVLAFLLPALKITHGIDWSWWIVLAPIWVPVVFICIVIALTAVALSGAEDCHGDYE